MLSALNATLTLQGYREAGTKSPSQAVDEICGIMYLNVLTHYLHPEENKVIGFPLYVSAEPAGLVCTRWRKVGNASFSPGCFHRIAIPLKCRAEVFIQSWSLPALGNERQQGGAFLLSGKHSRFVSPWKFLVYHTLK